MTASYSDGSTEDVTAQSTYNSSNPTVAAVDLSGTAQGISPGTFTVTAFFGGLSAITPTLTVLPAQVQAVSLSISPQNATIPVGLSVSFTVIATYSDGSTQDVTAQSTYSSSNTTVASTNSSGEAMGISPGTFVETANFEGLSASTQSLAVVAAQVVSLSISPQTTIIPVGATIPLVVIATYSDATTQDVTSQSIYNSTDTTIGTVDNGIATGVSPGVFRVGATFNGISTSTQDLNVRTQVSYVTNINGNSVSQCRLDSSGVLFDCVLATGYVLPEAIVLSTRALVAFVSQNSLASPIVACRVGLNDGMLMNCINTGFSQADDPQGLAINKNGTKLYVTTYSQSVYSCDINQTTGGLTGCVPTVSLGFSGSWTGFILNESENYAYISNYNGPIYRCAINPVDNTLESCINTNAVGFTTTDGIGLNNQYLYIASFANIIKCLLDPITGLASQCVDSGVGPIFSNAQNVTFTADQQFAYIPNRNSNMLTRCTVDSTTGEFGLCITALAGLNGPTSAFVR